MLILARESISTPTTPGHRQLRAARSARCPPLAGVGACGKVGPYDPGGKPRRGPTGFERRAVTAKESWRTAAQPHRPGPIDAARDRVCTAIRSAVDAGSLGVAQAGRGLSAACRATTDRELEALLAELLPARRRSPPAGIVARAQVVVTIVVVLLAAAVVLLGVLHGIDLLDPR